MAIEKMGSVLRSPFSLFLYLYMFYLRLLGEGMKHIINSANKNCYRKHFHTLN